jgi:hypothetical protein
MPLQLADLRGAQSVPIGDKDHGRDRGGCESAAVTLAFWSRSNPKRVGLAKQLNRNGDLT